MKHWSQRHSLVSAVWVLVEKDGKVLLLRRANTGYKDGQYTLPAGHTRDGELPSVAAVRELQEETDLVATPADLTLIHCMVYRALEGSHDRVSFFFKANRFKGEARNQEPDKCDQLLWADRDHLPLNTTAEIKHALREYAGGRLYSESFQNQP